MASKSEPSTRKMLVKGNAAAWYSPDLAGGREEAEAFLARCNPTEQGVAEIIEAGMIA